MLTQICFINNLIQKSLIKIQQFHKYLIQYKSVTYINSVKIKEITICIEIVSTTNKIRVITKRLSYSSEIITNCQFTDKIVIKITLNLSIQIIDSSTRTMQHK